MNTKSFIKNLPASLFLLVVSLAFLFPVFYTVMVSFRVPGYGLTSQIIPDKFYFGNYLRLMQFGLFPRQMLNSVINAVGGAIVTCACSALAAYAFARLKFKGKKVMQTFVFIVMMLPALTNMIPLYKIASDLKLLNTYTIMIIILGAYGIPLGIWIMKGFFESIPRELEEAAYIDGATPFQAFWRVVVPISSPGLVATFLINLVYNWNNFFTPLVMINKAQMNMATVGLYTFQHTLEGNQDELLAAGCVVIMVPTIILFIVMRRYFMQGMVEGAVKG